MAETIPQAVASAKFMLHTQMFEFPRTFEYNDRSYHLNKNVFSPIEFGSTKNFTEWLTAEKLGKFLEIGCGCGVTLCESLAKGAASSALGVDINPFAVHNTNENLKDLGLSNRGRAIESDIFSCITETDFDSIFWNTPFINAAFQDIAPHVLEQGLYDENYVQHAIFLDQARRYLSPEGKLYIGFGDFGDEALLYELLIRYGWKVVGKKVVLSAEINPVEFWLLICSRDT